MSRARTVTDPIKRNMMIPLQWFGDELDHRAERHAQECDASPIGDTNSAE